MRSMRSRKARGTDASPRMRRLQPVNGLSCLSKELFVRAEEVAGVLGISKPYAYKLVREMNEELKQKGFLTIPGRVSRNYFEEKFYGLRENQ